MPESITRDWLQVKNQTDVDRGVCLFTAELLTIFERFVPTVMVKRSKCQLPAEPKNTVYTATQEKNVEELLERQVEGQIQNVYLNQKRTHEFNQGCGYSPRNPGVSGNWKKSKSIQST